MNRTKVRANVMWRLIVARNRRFRSFETGDFLEIELQSTVDFGFLHELLVVCTLATTHCTRLLVAFCHFYFLYSIPSVYNVFSLVYPYIGAPHRACRMRP